MILSNSNFIVTYNTEFRIYNSTTLALLKTIEEPFCKLFEITNTSIFFTNSQGLYFYSIETGKRTEAIKIHGNAMITALFINGNFLYVGYDNGTIETYSFNEHLFKLQKTIRHSGLINTIKSDNIKIYITDLRNRITVYPDNIAYDFIQPKIFFDGYLYAISENKVYMNTKDAFGYLFELKEDPEDIIFSPKGGIMFARSGKSIRAYDSLGVELGRYFTKEFTVIKKEGKLMIVEEQGGTLKTIETYLKDIEKSVIEFTKVNIKEKVINEEEYEEKYKINVKNRKSTEKSPKGRSNITDFILNDSEPENSHQSIHKKSKMQISSSEEDEVEVNEITKISNSPIINPALLRKNPSTYENQEARLLYFSSQGFMIALDSLIANQVYIRYHTYELDPIEIKDTLKSTIGSFCGDNFVLSDGKTINFNDSWQMPYSCSLLGIDNKFIYSFDRNNLNIIDFRGKLVKTIYTPDSYSFCVGKERIAILCKTCVIFYSENRRTEYLPVSGIDFACFDGDILYVRIGKEIYELENGALVKVFETEERPLTIYEGNLVTLGENKLLPRPSVKYYLVRKEKIEEVDLTNLKK